MISSKLFMLSPLALVLSGCIAITEPTDIDAKADDAIDTVSKLQDKPKIIVSDKPYVNPTPVIRSVDKHAWLKNKSVEVKAGSSVGAIPFYEVINQLKSQGINISSELPLHSFSYNGFQIYKTDALTALDIVTSSVGMDFVVEDGVDGKGRYVRIIPMQTSEYTMSVGYRSIEDSMTFESSIGENLLSNSLSGGGQGGGSQGDSSGSQGGSSGVSGEGGSSSSKVTNDENLWEDLEAELSQMLTVSIPVSDNNVQANVFAGSQMQQRSNPRTALFQHVNIGSFSINKSTGHITVQAPKHVRKRVMDYIRTLDRQYNTQITVQAHIVVESKTDTESKGIDVSSFIQFANDKYGLALSNDVLGSVSVAMPTTPGDIFSVAAEGAAGSLTGIVSSDGLVQVFNAYVQSTNNAKTLLRPTVTTSSGMLGQFTNSRTQLLENFQSQTNNTNSSSTTSTNNQLIALDFGTTLKVLPRYDARKEVIRAQVSLKQVLANGTDTIEQVVNSDGGAKVIKTEYPIQELVDIQGEVVGRNGSMVILGGQELVTYQNDNGGTSGLKDTYLGGLFGSSNQVVKRQKYYLVLFLKATTHAETRARRKGA